jgi:hypothetical protein
MIYDCYNIRGGRLVSTVGNVAAPVRLTGAVLTNGSALVTVDSTANLWPGMLLQGRNIPTGTLVLSVDTATTFTMTANASAAVAAPGVIVVALGYDTTVRTGTFNIENYRNLFSGLGSQQGAATASGTAVALGGPEGYGVILDPTQALTPVKFTSVDPNNAPVAVSYFLTGTPKVVVSDHVLGVAPREQTQKVTYVRFICTDGSQVPVQWTPTLHIVQRQV